MLTIKFRMSKCCFDNRADAEYQVLNFEMLFWHSSRAPIYQVSNVKMLFGSLFFAFRHSGWGRLSSSKGQKCYLDILADAEYQVLNAKMLFWHPSRAPIYEDSNVKMLFFFFFFFFSFFVIWHSGWGRLSSSEGKKCYLDILSEHEYIKSRMSKRYLIFVFVLRHSDYQVLNVKMLFCFSFIAFRFPFPVFGADAEYQVLNVEMIFSHSSRVRI